MDIENILDKEGLRKPLMTKFTKKMGEEMILDKLSSRADVINYINDDVELNPKEKITVAMFAENLINKVNKKDSGYSGHSNLGRILENIVS